MVISLNEIVESNYVSTACMLSPLEGGLSFEHSAEFAIACKQFCHYVICVDPLNDRVIWFCVNITNWATLPVAGIEAWLFGAIPGTGLQEAHKLSRFVGVARAIGHGERSVVRVKVTSISCV